MQGEKRTILPPFRINSVPASTVVRCCPACAFFFFFFFFNFLPRCGCNMTNAGEKKPAHPAQERGAGRRRGHRPRDRRKNGRRHGAAYRFPYARGHKIFLRSSLPGKTSALHISVSWQFDASRRGKKGLKSSRDKKKGTLP